MKRLLALLLVPACTGGDRANTGQCPDGEVCSPLTPNGLQFIGNDLVDSLNLVGPSATAIGGTQAIALQYDRASDGVLIALDLPFKAETSGNLGVTVSATSGSVVTVQGSASGTNYLRIVDANDNTLFDRKLIGAGAVDKIELIPSTFEHVPADADLAWAPGTFDIGVALYGTVGSMTDQRLVDNTMTLDLAGAAQSHWDTVHVSNAQPGTSTLMVTAGDKPPATIDVVVVANADSVGPSDAPASVMANTPVEVCFTATSGTRTIIGLPWTFTVDGVAGSAGLSPNCADVKTMKTSGSISIVASAGGQSATLVLPVGAMARTAPRPARELPTTAGERASM